MRIDNIIVDKEYLAQLFGVSTITVDGWIRGGCPVAQQGGRGVKYQFNTAAVINWVREKERSKGAGTATAPSSDWRDKQQQYATELKEIELAEKRRSLVPVEEVLEVLGEQLGEVRTRLFQIAQRCAANCAATDDPDEVERLVSSEVDEALTDLVADKPEQWAAAA